jgi:hypothetical protein
MIKILDDSEHNRKDCRFYGKHGVCSHPEVQEQKKRCLGTVICGVWEKRKNWNEVIQQMAKQNRGE